MGNKKGQVPCFSHVPSLIPSGCPPNNHSSSSITPPVRPVTTPLAPFHSSFQTELVYLPFSPLYLFHSNIPHAKINGNLHNPKNQYNYREITSSSKFLPKSYNFAFKLSASFEFFCHLPSPIQLVLDRAEPLVSRRCALGGVCLCFAPVSISPANFRNFSKSQPFREQPNSFRTLWKPNLIAGRTYARFLFTKFISTHNRFHLNH